VFSNPELDTEGRRDWLLESNDWFWLDDGQARLFFDNTISRDDYTECLVNIESSVAIAESTWGLRQGPEIDIYLYKSSDQLFDYTTRSRGFSLPHDNEIHLSVDDIDDTEHLAGWLVSQRLNTRPDATVFPLLRAGLNHYFMGTRPELDRLAAHYIYYYGGEILDTGVLFPLSYDYTFSDEYTGMSASFLHYLLEEGRVSSSDLTEFYRLLWSNPRMMWAPPMMAGLMSLNYSEGDVRSWQHDALIGPEELDDLFRIVLRIDISAEIGAWQDTLQDEIAAVTAELGTISAQVERVDIDLSTPESSLESWWQAYRAGDFDGMIEASTPEIASVLTDARNIYIAQGVLDQVIVDYFIRPYRGATLTVLQDQPYGNELHVFEVVIERGEASEYKTIVVRRSGSMWLVDEN
jgi:hypothetical protein